MKTIYVKIWKPMRPAMCQKDDTSIGCNEKLFGCITHQTAYTLCSVFGLWISETIISSTIICTF